MEEFITTIFAAHKWLQWLIIFFGAGFAYMTMIQVKKVFSCVDEEMWGDDQQKSPSQT